MCARTAWHAAADTWTNRGGGERAPALLCVNSRRPPSSTDTSTAHDTPWPTKIMRGCGRSGGCEGPTAVPLSACARSLQVRAQPRRLEQESLVAKCLVTTGQSTGREVSDYRRQQPRSHALSCGAGALLACLRTIPSALHTTCVSVSDWLAASRSVYLCVSQATWSVSRWCCPSASAWPRVGASERRGAMCTVHTAAACHYLL